MTDELPEGYDPFDPPMADFDVTCHSEGCWNNGITIRVPVDSVFPLVWCGGGCNQQVTDIVLVD